jgi:hypothetical protein
LLRLRSLTFVRAGFHVSAQANCLPYRSCCRKEISPRVLSPSWPGVAALWPMSTTVASGGPLGRSHSAPVPCRAFLAISHMHGRSPGSPAEPQTSLSARLSRRVRRPMTSRSRSSTMAIQPSRRRIGELRRPGTCPARGDFVCLSIRPSAPSGPTCPGAFFEDDNSPRTGLGCYHLRAQRGEKNRRLTPEQEQYVNPVASHLAA